MKKMKAMLSEIKENVQGTNSDAKETRTQINGVDQKEERNIQPEKNEETRIQIMKENFPNLAKEIDFQQLQEAQRVPKRMDPRRNIPRHIIITLPKMEYKERNLKAAREKEYIFLQNRITVYLQRSSHKVIS